MSDFVTLFQDFLEIMLASILAFTAYNVYERYVDRQDKKDALRSIADTHQMTMNSLLGMHSVARTHEAMEKSEKKEPQNNGTNAVTVIHEVTREKESEKQTTNGGK